MSLKVEDWKAVLDQPKNAGLKAFGGTGLSQILRNFADADGKFQQNKGLTQAADRKRALKSVITTCDEVIRKHQKTFTTACNYLAEVKRTAAERMTTVERELAEIQEGERLKHVAENAREFAKETCAKTKRELSGARDMQQIHTLWKDFADRIGTAAEHVAKLHTVSGQVKGFKKEPALNGGVDSVRPLYLNMLREVEKAL